MHGKGVFTYSDGKKYDGDFVEDKREGYGTLTSGGGKTYKGQWKKGK